MRKAGMPDWHHPSADTNEYVFPMKKGKPLINCNEVICPHCNAKFTWVVIQTKDRTWTGSWHKPKISLIEENDFFPIGPKDDGHFGYLDDKGIRGGACRTLNKGTAKLCKTRKQAKKMGIEIKA